MLNIRKRFFLLLTIVGLLFSIASCTTANDYVKLSFDQDSYVVHEGQTLDVNPIINKGSNVGSISIEYTSYDGQIATYVNGKLTGVRTGETIIKVVCTEKPVAYDVATVKVVANSLPEVKFGEVKANMIKGTEQKISYTFSPDYADALMSFSSANPEIATVDANGTIKAVSAGKAVIVVRATDKLDSTQYKDYTFNIEVLEADFAINYELNGGTNDAENPAGYNVLSLPLTIKPASKLGYNFLGWYDNAEFTGEPITEIATDHRGDVTLYAKWEIVNYNLTYVLNEGTNSVENPATYNVTELPLTIKNATREAHNFLGWYLNPEFTGEVVTSIDAETTGDITLYAKWEVSIYGIEYELNGGTNNEANGTEYNINTLPYNLAEPTKLGHTFLGWYHGDEKVTAVPEGTTGIYSVEAKWELTTYSINYDLAGGSWNDLTDADYPYGKNREALVDAFLEHAMTVYSVTDKPTDMLSFATKFAKDIQGAFTGEWSWIKDYILSATEDAAIKSSLESGNASFWRYSTGAFLFKEVRASWPKSQDFSSDEKANGFWGLLVPATGEIPTSYTMESEEVALPTVAYKTGYAFKGFFDAEGNKVEKIAKGSTGNVSVKAEWELVTYTITYNHNGGNFDIYEYATREAMVDAFLEHAMAIYGKTGEKPNGMVVNTGDTTIGFSNMFETSGIVKAFTPEWNWLRQYVIDQTTIADTKAKLEANNESFWRYSLGAFLFKEHRASWPKSEDFTVDEKANGFWNLILKEGAVLPTTTYTVLDTVALLDPVRPGCTFLGWYLNGTKVTEIAKGTTGNLTLEAKWYDPEAKLPINYNLNGGSIADTDPTTFVAKDGLATLPVPTKPGYTFDKWYSDAECTKEVTSIEAGRTEGFALYATWILDTYKIEYETNGGEFLSDSVVDIYDSFDAIVADFLADYSTLTGLTDLTAANFYGKSNQYGLYGFFKNEELSVKWAWLLDFIVDKAEAVNYAGKAYLNIAAGAANFNKYARSNFAAFLQQNALTSINPASMNFAGVDSEALWQACPDKLIQVGIEAKYEYTVLELPLQLATPNKEGATFVGWYTNADLKNGKVNELTIDLVGNVKLYARWSDSVITFDTYQINYELAGGNLPTEAPATYVEEQGVKLVAPTRKGYEFAGWYLDAACTKAVTEFTAEDKGDKTVYASWTIITYSVTYEANGGVLPTKSVRVSGWDTVDQIVEDLLADYSAYKGVQYASVSELGTAAYPGDADRDFGTFYLSTNAAGVKMYEKYGWFLDYLLSLSYPGSDIVRVLKLYDDDPAGKYYSGTVENANDTYGMYYAMKGFMQAKQYVPTSQWWATADFTDEAIRAKALEFAPKAVYEQRPIDGTYTIETLPFELPIPAAPEGKFFTGWYLNADLSGDAISEIPAGTAQSVTVYAGYADNGTEVKHNIEYVLDGGQLPEGAPTTYVQGAGLALDFAATKEGYVFAGWFLDASFTQSITTIPTDTFDKYVLYAKFTIDSYDVTFENSDLGTQALEFNSELPAATKEGHTFAGWFLDAEFTGEALTKVPAKDTTVYAKWNVNSYELTFENSDLGTQTLEYGKEMPETSKEGYSFAGWFTNAEFIGNAVLTVPAENCTVYALYLPNKYYVTFENSTLSKAYLEFDTELPVATKDGETFMGWYANAEFTGEKVTKVVAKDMTVYAKWGYTVKFENTDLEDQVLEYVHVLPTVTKEGHVFGGWYDNAEFAGEALTKVTSDCTIYAKWIINQYEVTYVLADLEKQTLDYGTELPKPTKVGYTFAGWYADDKFTGEAITKVGASNITVYAKWDINKYEITFENCDFEEKTQTLLFDNELPKPTKVGHSFAGWYKNADLTGEVLTKVPGENVTLYASYTRNNYKVEFDTSFETKTLPYDSVLEIPTRDGYTFLGWFDNAELTGEAITKVPANDIKLYAKWELTKYTVTFENSDLEPQKYNFGTELPEATKEGYTFKGWYATAELTGDAVTTVGKTDMTVYAKWEINKYNVTYNNAEGLTKEELDYNTVLPEPTKEGYTFKGWFTDAEYTSEAVTKVPANDLTVYAKWEINKYTVKFENSTLEDQELDFGATLPEATKEGYTFKGWYATDLATGEAITKVAANDMTVYAKWEINKYEINFENSDLEKATLEYNAKLPEATKEGYTFAGWFENSDLSGEAITNVPAKAVTLYAKWVINKYNVTFENTNLEAQELDYNTTLPTPVREGYTFGGWYTTPDFTGEAVTKVGASDLTVYAKWTINGYTVVFENSDLEAKEYDFGATLPEPTKGNLTFAGWYLNAEFDGEAVVTVPAKDITVYAKWVYNITFENSDLGTQQLLPDAKLPELSKEGYTFVGWYDNAELTGEAYLTVGDSDVTLWPQFKINNYFITFEGSDLGTKVLDYGTTLPEPTKEGYTFDGWFLDAEYTGEAVTKVGNNDLTVYAKWIINQYTVKYENVEGMTEDVLDYATVLATPTKEGFTFGGWFLNAEFTGEAIVAVPAKDVTVYAKWGHTLTFVNADLEAGVYVPGTKLPTATQEGYTFIGWTTDVKGLEFINEVPTADTTLYAQWVNEIPAVKTITVGADQEYTTIKAAIAAANPGDTIQVLPGDYNEEIVIDKDRIQLVGTTTANANARSAATNVNRIVIKANGVTVDGFVIAYGAKNVSKVEIANANISDTTIRNITVLKAADTTAQNVGIITMKATGSNVIRNVVIDNVVVEQRTGRPTLMIIDQVTNLTITNSKFYGATSAGNYTDGLKIGNNGSYGVKGNILIDNNLFENYHQYVLWFKKTHTANMEISNNTFKNCGQTAGSHGALTLASWNSSAKVIEVNFHHNTLENAYMLFRADSRSGATAENTILKCNYNVTTGSKATYHVKNATAVTVDATNNYYDVAPTDAKYSGSVTWDAPYTDASQIPTAPARNNNILSLVLMGGKVEGETKVAYDTTSAAYKLPTPTKEGYYFTGWVDADGNKVEELAIGTKGEISVYATWYRLPVYYQVSYEFNGGTVDGELPAELLEGTSVELPSATRDEYHFAGWYTNAECTGEPITSIDQISSNMTLYIKWVPFVYININYELNGGTLPADAPTKFVEGAGIELVAPIRDGFKFLGWYESPLCIGTPITAISAQTKEEPTLYALWLDEDGAYDVTYTLNGGNTIYETRDEMVRDFVVDFNKFAGKTVAADGSDFFARSWVGEGSAGYKFLTSEDYGAKWAWLLKYVNSVRVANGKAELKADDNQAEARGDLHNFLNSTGNGNDGGNKDYGCDYSSYAVAEGFWGLLQETLVVTDTNTLVTPTRLHYVFEGWYDNAEFTGNPVTTLDKDCTLYAKWSKDMHKLTYIVNNDAITFEEETRDFHASDSFVLTVPTYDKMSWKFNGWYTDAACTNPITEISEYTTSDITVYASWTEVLGYTINYVLNGGSLVYETREALVADLLKDYNEAQGKSYASAADVPTAVFADIDWHTFYTKTLADGTNIRVKWLWLAEYLYELSSVKLASNNCNVLGLKALINGSSYSGDAIYGVSYAFRAFVKGTTIRPDTSYVSVDFAIYENANGFWDKLSAAENGQYMNHKGTVTPLTAYLENYTFKGWYLTNDFTGEAVTSVTPEMTVDNEITLYAKWGEGVPVESITITNKLTEIKRYGTHQLTWAFNPEKPSIETVKFESSDPSVATVDAFGLVTAVNAGTVTIKIISQAEGNKVDQFTMEVYSPDHFDAKYDTESYVAINKEIGLTATLVKRDGTVAQITSWTSLNEDIATVNNGAVKGVAAGVATIRAIVSEGVYFDFVVTVLPETVSAALQHSINSHESNVFIRYELGIGAGGPAYYMDIFGSVSKMLYNKKLYIDEKYLQQSTDNGQYNKDEVKNGGLEFITVHYTGNMGPGADSDNNASYFAGAADVSIHYVTGNEGKYSDGTPSSAVYKLLDHAHGAYHAGDSGAKDVSGAFKWTATGVKYDGADLLHLKWSASDDFYFEINGQKTAVKLPGTWDYKNRGTDHTFNADGTISSKDGYSSSSFSGRTPESFFNCQGFPVKVENGEYYMGTTWWCYTQVYEGRICGSGGNRNSIGIESCVDLGSDLWYTWQNTAQLVAKLMFDNNLDITRVKGHHFFAAKDCPQPLLENDQEIWWEFIDLVKAEYELLTTYKDYTYTFEVEGETTTVNNYGRVVEQPEFTEVVTYTVTVSNGTTTETITLATMVEGIYNK